MRLVLVRLALVLALATVALSLLAVVFTPVGLAASLSTAPDLSKSNGAQIFELHCAGCHAQGGNIVRRGKNLKLKALQRYEMDSTAAIAQIVAQGKGNMSAYQDRLTSAEIQAVVDYVLEQANQGWNPG